MTDMTDAMNDALAMTDDRPDTSEEPEERGAPEPAAGNDPQHLRLLEALLFASTDPVSEVTLASRLPEGVDVKSLIGELQQIYAGRGVNLARVAGKWAFRTAPDLGNILRVERNVVRKLSRAGVETLATIAYHQPVTRAEIEEIRGVQLSKGTFDTLFESGWIKPVGRRRTPGRPVTWGTTDAFLAHFGLESVSDLPGIDELKAAGLLDSRPAGAIIAGSRGAEAAAAEDAPVESDDPETGSSEDAEEAVE
jgi:segregation and condensation protein B